MKYEEMENSCKKLFEENMSDTAKAWHLTPLTFKSTHAFCISHGTDLCSLPYTINKKEFEKTVINFLTRHSLTHDTEHILNNK